MSRWFFAICLWAGIVPLAMAQTGDPSSHEATAAALQAALLGDTQSLERIAGTRAEWEKQQDAPEERLADNLAALAAISGGTLPAREVFDEKVSSFRGDESVAVLRELIERHEPQSRFRRTRSANRYEGIRQFTQSATQTAQAALTLQLFALIQPPIDLAAYTFSGRRYANPLERRELAAARAAADTPGGEKASRRADTLRPKRYRLARLQALENARLAERQGRLETARWWYEREQMLAGGQRPLISSHLELLERLAQRERDRIRSVSVLGGEERLREPDLFLAYSHLVEAFAKDPASEHTLEAAQDLRIAFPKSEAIDEAEMATIVHDLQSGDSLLARIQMQDLAKGRTGWSERIAAYLDRPEFHPARALNRAEAEIARSKRDYLLWGTEPSTPLRHLSAEQARQRDAGWVRTLRSLFVFDAIGRTLFYPFVPSSVFPRQVLFDAAARIDAEYFESDEGREALADIARAYTKSNRHGAAARLYRELDMSGEEARARERAARALFRRAEAAPDPIQRIALCRRILNAYPDTKAARRAEDLLSDARFEAEVIVWIPRRELLEQPELWRTPRELFASSLLDGKSSNGELGRQGVALLHGERIAYTDRISGERIVVPADADSFDRTLARLHPARRARALGEGLERARERPVIPLVIEGGAFPGFDAMPGLAPLEPGEDELRLYE